MTAAIASKIGLRRTRPAPGDGEVDRALDGEGNRAIRAGHEREDRRPIELFHSPYRHGVVEHIHWDPDDLALLLAQVRDRVDEDPLRERQADRHLVNHARVEDVFQALEWAEVLPLPGQSEFGRVVEEADDAQPELAMVLELVGERLSARARAEDQHESEVLASSAAPFHRQAKHDPGQDRRGSLRGEEHQQERAADVRQPEHEQDAEGDEREDECCAQDVERLPSDRPSRPRPIQPVDRERDDPGGRVDHQQRLWHRDDQAPPLRPVLAEPPR